ncbi:MAG: 1-acyl-sn-glycerol-3-phosphate acyltransferase [Candidatus Sericytochromatia bacterium]|nr:1-acyl-sn-glycerol-3-phosphate acyltransferase [Candidatus Sericytochromatia bacterium]
MGIPGLWVEGNEALPLRGAVLLVANHRSPLDVLWLSLASPRPVHVVTAAWLRLFGLGLWGPGIGLHPLPWHARRSDLVHLVRPMWDRGEVVLVFPEGMSGVMWPAPKGGMGLCRLGAGALVREARRSSHGLTVVVAYVQAQWLSCGLALPPVRIGFKRLGPLPVARDREDDDHVVTVLKQQILSCCA